RRKRSRNGLLRASSEFFGKFLNKTLCRPGTSFAKSANCAPGNVVADRFERLRIYGDTAAAQHSVGDFLHPERAFPARCALAAALVRIELVDVIERPNHIACSIEPDNAAGTSQL